MLFTVVKYVGINRHQPEKLVKFPSAPDWLSSSSMSGKLNVFACPTVQAIVTILHHARINRLAFFSFLDPLSSVIMQNTQVQQNGKGRLIRNIYPGYGIFKKLSKFGIVFSLTFLRPELYFLSRYGSYLRFFK